MSIDKKPVAILVAEDEPLVRMIATDLLEDAGFKVIEAVNAIEAVTLLEARPDVRVLFTDIEMPVPDSTMDGVMLAHLASKRWPQLGIIVTSGRVFPAEGDLPAGAKFIPKPYLPSVLLHHIRKFVEANTSILVQGQVSIETTIAEGGPAMPAGVVIDPVAEAAPQGLAAPVSEPDKS